MNPRTPQRMSFLTLPNEIIINIARYLAPPYLSRLSLTSRYSYDVIIHMLHQLALRSVDGFPAMIWATLNGHRTLIKLLVNLGVDINATYRRVTALRLAIFPINFNIKGFNLAPTLVLQRRCIKMVRALLDNGADINTLGGLDRRPPLHFLLRYARWGGSVEMVDLFVRKGARVDDQNSEGRNALQMAAILGAEPEVIRRLLRAQVDVNHHDYCGNTTLHYLVKQGYCIEEVIMAGADVDKVNYVGESVVHWAAENKIDMPLKILTKYKPSMDIQDGKGQTGLHKAASPKRCKPEYTRQRWEIRTPYINTALHLAASTGLFTHVKKLLRYGAGVNVRNADGQTALHLAVHTGCEQSVETLIENGANKYLKDYQGQTALHIAASKPSSILTRALLWDYQIANANGSAGVKIAFPDIQDNYGLSALHCAVLGGKLDSVKVLLANDANPNIRAIDGGTALHLAAWINIDSIVTVLLEKGANPDIQMKPNGHTPLHLAAIGGIAHVAHTLLAMYANPNIQDNSGQTALHLVAINDLAIANEIMAEGGNPDIKDGQGQTALHIAGYHDSRYVFKALLVGGVDIDIQDKCGRTALHVVVLRGFKKLAEMLKRNAELETEDNEGRTQLDVIEEMQRVKRIRQADWVASIGDTTQGEEILCISDSDDSDDDDNNCSDRDSSDDNGSNGEIGI